MNSYVNDNLINHRGLAYSDGFFSTMGVYQCQIFWLEYHVERLLSHALALQLDIDINSITHELKRQAQAIGEGIIKVVVTRREQALFGVNGYGYINGHSDIYIKKSAITMPCYHKLQSDSDIPQQEAGQAICLTSQIALLPKPLAGLKSLNRLDSVMVAGELQQKKQHNKNLVEGLVADVTGDWIEGIMSNVFYQLYPSQSVSSNFNSEITSVSNVKQIWYTPSLAFSGVKGVMRQVLIDKLTANGQQVIERNIKNTDFSHLASLFFCNAVRGIIPISTLWLTEYNDDYLEKRVELSSVINI